MITKNFLYLLSSSVIFLSLLISMLGIKSIESICIEFFFIGLFSFIFKKMKDSENLKNHQSKFFEKQNELIKKQNDQLNLNRPSLKYLMDEGFINIVKKNVKTEIGIETNLFILPEESCPYPIAVRRISEDIIEIFYEDMKNYSPLKIKLTLY